MTNDEKILDLQRRLGKINKLVFATAGKPLDAERYFAIRELCSGHFEQGKQAALRTLVSVLQFSITEGRAKSLRSTQFHSSAFDDMERRCARLKQEIDLLVVEEGGSDQFEQHKPESATSN